MASSSGQPISGYVKSSRKEDGIERITLSQEQIPATDSSTWRPPITPEFVKQTTLVDIFQQCFQGDLLLAGSLTEKCHYISKTANTATQPAIHSNSQIENQNLEGIGPSLKAIKADVFGESHNRNRQQDQIMDSLALNLRLTSGNEELLRLGLSNDSSDYGDIPLNSIFGEQSKKIKETIDEEALPAETITAEQIDRIIPKSLTDADEEFFRQHEQASADPYPGINKPHVADREGFERSALKEQFHFVEERHSPGSFFEYEAKSGHGGPKEIADTLGNGTEFAAGACGTASCTAKLGFPDRHMREPDRNDYSISSTVSSHGLIATNNLIGNDQAQVCEPINLISERCSQTKQTNSEGTSPQILRKDCLEMGLISTDLSPEDINISKAADKTQQSNIIVFQDGAHLKGPIITKHPGSCIFATSFDLPEAVNNSLDKIKHLERCNIAGFVLDSQTKIREADEKLHECEISTVAADKRKQARLSCLKTDEHGLSDLGKPLQTQDKTLLENKKHKTQHISTYNDATVDGSQETESHNILQEPLPKYHTSFSISVEEKRDETLRIFSKDVIMNINKISAIRCNSPEPWPDGFNEKEPIVKCEALRERSVKIENIDIKLRSNKAPRRRLPDGANHKRAAHELLHLQPLQTSSSFSISFCGNFEKRHLSVQQKRRSTGGWQYHPYAKRGRASHDHSQLTAEDGSMPGEAGHIDVRAVTRERLGDQYQEGGSSPVVTELSSTSAQTSRTVSLESADPVEASEEAGEMENDEIRTIRRVTPEDEKILRRQKKHESPAPPADPKRIGLTGSENFGESGVAENPNSIGDEQDDKDLDECQSAPKKKRPPWQFGGRYYESRLSAAVPDYRSPSLPKTNVPRRFSAQRAPAMGIPGGPKPINKLGQPHTNKSRSPSIPKTYNLTGKPRPIDPLPAKGSKFEGKPVPSQQSSREIIDLDPEPLNDHGERKPSIAMSFRSQSPTGQRRTAGQKHNGKGIDEYRNVQNAVMSKLGRQPPREDLAAGQIFTSDKGILRQTVVKPGDLEDPYDPIEGEYGEELDSVFPNVVDPSRRASQASISSDQQRKKRDRRTALGQPLSETKTRGRDSNPAPAKTPSISQHFAKPAGRRPMRDSGELDPLQEADTAQRHDTRQQTRNRGVKSIVKPSSSSAHIDEDFLDHLGVGHYDRQMAPHKQKAQELCAERDAVKSLAAGMKTNFFTDNATIVECDTDDDEVNARANIPSTSFKSSTRAKSNNKVFEKSYVVLIAVSESKRWLSDYDAQSWNLTHRAQDKEGDLTLFNEDGRPVWSLLVKKIEKINFNPQSSILAIHTSREMNARLGSFKYFLEFENPEAAIELYRSVMTTHGTISSNKRSVESLCGAIKNFMKPKVESRPKEAIADDIQLAVTNSQRRTQTAMRNVQELRRNVSSLSPQDEVPGGSHDVGFRSKRVVNSMRTRSSPNPSKENLEVPKTIPGTKFYGTPDDLESPVAKTRETRTSSRQVGRDSLCYQARDLTPSPDRWTDKNPDWESRWQDSVVFPREGKDKAAVDGQDIQRLDEGEFLNDNLIGFYLLWLEDRMNKEHPELVKRIYFQNTFFYTRLTNPAKGRKGIHHEAVARWTAKVNLFEYDYIIVPVNEHTHWYVAIICNPAKLLSSLSGKTDQANKDINRPDRPKSQPDGISRIDSPSVASPNDSLATHSDPIVRAGIETMSLEDEDQQHVEIEGDQNQHERNLYENRLAKDDIDEQSGLRILEPLEHGSSRIELDRPEGIHEGITSLVKSDTTTQHSTTKKSNQSKKTKRKSIPGPRKYDPKDLRIITLDSLGISHSPTCTNLRDYLVAELKSKQGEEVIPPTSIGMTAKNIPLQDNFCDCGLFLLSYIETFLKDPDDFVYGILQNRLDVELKWPKATEMRDHIRHLLFELQEDQIEESQRIHTEKRKGKEKLKAKGTAKQGKGRDVHSPQELKSHEEPSVFSASPNNHIVGPMPTYSKGATKVVIEIPASIEAANMGTVAGQEAIYGQDQSYDMNGSGEEQNGKQKSIFNCFTTKVGNMLGISQQTSEHPSPKNHNISPSDVDSSKALPDLQKPITERMPPALSKLHRGGAQKSSNEWDQGALNEIADSQSKSNSSQEPNYPSSSVRPKQSSDPSLDHTHQATSRLQDREQTPYSHSRSSEELADNVSERWEGIFDTSEPDRVRLDRKSGLARDRPHGKLVGDENEEMLFSNDYQQGSYTGETKRTEVVLQPNLNSSLATPIINKQHTSAAYTSDTSQEELSRWRRSLSPNIVFPNIRKVARADHHNERKRKAVSVPGGVRPHKSAKVVISRDSSDVGIIGKYGRHTKFVDGDE